MNVPETGSIIGAKYRVERLIGTGGMGAVLEVTHVVTGKHFAIKWLLPEISQQPGAVKRFIREAQVAGRFAHPNVIEVYDIAQQDDSYYMVMELLHGESLADRLERTGPLSVMEACQLLAPCIDAVSAAHKAGIIHRDLKPSNLFLCRAVGQRGELPKVVDFGIARLTPTPGQPDSTQTQTGVVIGTPHYMAPEQMRGAEIDARVDVYAFGVILYQALTAQLPFKGESYPDLILNVLSAEPRPISEYRSDVPAALAAVISKAMARQREARFADLGELAAALAPFYHSERLAAVSPAAEGGVSVARAELATPFATDHARASPAAPARVPRALRWSLTGAGLAVVALGLLSLNLWHRAVPPTSRLANDASHSGSAPMPHQDAQSTLELPRPNTTLTTQPLAAGRLALARDAGTSEGPALATQSPPPAATRTQDARRSKRADRPASASARARTVDSSVQVARDAEPNVTPAPAEPEPAGRALPRVRLGKADFAQQPTDAGAPRRPKAALDWSSFLETSTP